MRFEIIPASLGKSGKEESACSTAKYIYIEIWQAILFPKGNGGSISIPSMSRKKRFNAILMAALATPRRCHPVCVKVNSAREAALFVLWRYKINLSGENGGHICTLPRM